MPKPVVKKPVLEETEEDRPYQLAVAKIRKQLGVKPDEKMRAKLRGLYAKMMEEYRSEPDDPKLMKELRFEVETHHRNAYPKNGDGRIDFGEDDFINAVEASMKLAELESILFWSPMDFYWGGELLTICHKEF